MRTLLASACMAALLASSQPASATLIKFQASFSGSQETPPNASAGSGSATLTADTTAQTLAVSESFAALSSPSMAGHLHAGATGVAGPIILPFAPFPTGVTAGSFAGTFTAAQLINQATSGITSFAGLLNALEAGDTYLNIHTSSFPAGEIRAQVGLASVPEPITAALMAVAIAALAVARTRRS